MIEIPDWLFSILFFVVCLAVIYVAEAIADYNINYFWGVCFWIAVYAIRKYRKKKRGD